MAFALIRNAAGTRLAVPSGAATGLRTLVTALCAVLTALEDPSARSAGWLVALAVVAAVASAGPREGLAGDLLRTGEAVVAAVAVLATGAATSPVFPYLLAPAAAGGLTAGTRAAVVPPGWACVALLAGYPAGHHHAPVRVFVGATTQWVLLALAVGLLGAWVRRLVAAQRPPYDAPYAAAYRLLTELRTVARRLPGGLDPIGIAQGLLASVKQECGYDRAAVFARVSGGRLVPVTIDGTASVDWDVDVRGETPFAEAWSAQRPVVRNQTHTHTSGLPRAGSSAVVPLRIGVRSFGLVGFESSEHMVYADARMAAVQELADATALRLETAMLFDEVRHLATAEERQRLAREIHDGIAQELVYLGYVLDGVTSDAAAGREGVVGQLRELRGEVTRIVSELRHSIFDLRTEVDRSDGLGAALSRYVRWVGRNSGLTVHLSLAESAMRLSLEAEAELLRIAQEAISTARRQAQVANIWVTLEVEPPAARLVVEHDGTGGSVWRDDEDTAIALMRERASRLRGRLAITPRQPRGMRVELSLGGVALTTA